MKKLTKSALVRSIFIAIVSALSGMGAAQAQTFAVKTNVLDDAFLNLNLGAEVALAPKWTFDLTWDLNAWEINGKLWKHWLLQPEARYWLCDRWDGHFFGAHLLGGQYNMGNLKMHDFLGTPFGDLKDHRYQGWYGGVGIAYGYNWMLSKHWNLEAEIGLGWVYTRYDKFNCMGCGKKVDSNHPHNYVGPTKAAISIVYIFD